ncbi:MAG TPA: hypothetical protein VFI39_08580 [Gemmatimonadales bacterium]|nr:hypothetical protein [Gemmatimonadales bacterium]
MAQQAGRSRSDGLPMSSGMDAATEVSDAAYHRADRPRASAFLDPMWFRLASTLPAEQAPDLHLSGNDYATAGAPVTLWLSNESVTADDPIFLGIRVDAVPRPAGSAEPVYVTTTGAVAPGGYGSRIDIDLPALTAGTYLVSIEAREPATGRHHTSTRTLIVR